MGAYRRYSEIQPPPELLVKAKQYLCWERFPDLAIQLVRIDRPVGYWLPPGETHTILVFYRDADVEDGLFLLFHELGHYLCAMEGAVSEGTERAGEIWAWERGREELEDFIAREGLDTGLLERYDRFAEISLRSYGIPQEQYKYSGQQRDARRSKLQGVGVQKSEPGDAAGKQWTTRAVPARQRLGE